MKVIAQGTGQALDTARRGDADVVLVFELQQITSESFTFQSGQSDIIQGKTQTSVPRATAAKTKTVTVHVNVEECLTSRASKTQARK